jgi:hypothetical protein
MTGLEDSPRPQGVHFIGSLPQDRFSNRTDVFTELSGRLAGRLRRIPDGELGERYYYIQWQESVSGRDPKKYCAARRRRAA